MILVGPEVGIGRSEGVRAAGEILLMVPSPTIRRTAAPLCDRRRERSCGGGVGGPGQRDHSAPSLAEPNPAPELPGPPLARIARAIDPGGVFFRRGRASAVRGGIMLIGPIVLPALRLTTATHRDRGRGGGAGRGGGGLPGVPRKSIAETSSGFGAAGRPLEPTARVIPGGVFSGHGGRRRAAGEVLAVGITGRR